MDLQGIAAVTRTQLTLSRLYAHGYLELRKDLPENSASTKRVQYYRLTPQGNKALAGLKRQMEMMWDGIDPVFLDDKAEG